VSLSFCALLVSGTFSVSDVNSFLMNYKLAINIELSIKK